MVILEPKARLKSPTVEVDPSNAGLRWSEISVLSDLMLPSYKKLLKRPDLRNSLVFIFCLPYFMLDDAECWLLTLIGVFTA